MGYAIWVAEEVADDGGGDRLRSPKVCPLRLRGDLTNLFGGFSLCDPWRAPCQQTGMGDPHHPDGMPLELP